MRRSSWLFVASAVALGGVLFLFVFPTSSWLAQRRDRQAVETELRLLTSHNRSLERRVRVLSSPIAPRVLAHRYRIVPAIAKRTPAAKSGGTVSTATRMAR